MYIKKNAQKKIKVIFYTKEQIIKEYWFEITSSLKDIFMYFEKHIKEKGYSLKSKYKIFGNEINELCQISELIKNEKNNKILEGEIWIEVEEETFFDDENDETFFTILQPKLNPFQLIEYNSLKSKIKIISCPKDILLNSYLNKFTKESAFCNSVNSLYMSGGEIYGRAINNFWIINKHNYKITKQFMPISKKYHSMLYIPDNFIFIVGGDSLNTIIYDIENQEFINWANMNKKHFQPGLYILGDYVYAFSSLNDINKDKNYFEKTNLTCQNPKWEIIFPKFNNNIKMNSTFFGISKFSDGNILFLGGEKNNPTYLYNPIENKMSIFNRNNLSIPFWDKTFYKISKYYNICIPLNFSNNNKLIFFDKEDETLKEVIYDKKTGFVNFSLKKNETVGNIYIQSTLRDVRKNENVIIKIGINPKHDLKKIKNENDSKNNFEIEENNIVNNDNVKLDEEKEIIINEYFDNNLNEENHNKAKLNKVFKNKRNYFYIPDSFLDEQIINREIDLNGKKNNNEKYNDISNENINEEKYVIVNTLNPINENINTKVSKSKQYLYIPDSIMDEQITNRELILNENKQNNNDKEIKQKNIDEEKIILSFENENNNNYEPENDTYKIKSNRKNFLYIPLSSFEEQFINRNIEINEKNIFNDIQKNDENNLENITEEINIKYLSNEKENIKPKIKNDNKKAKIYIPENIIEEIIIKREVLPDNFDDDEIIIKNKIRNYLNQGDGKENNSEIKKYHNLIDENIINREVISNNKKQLENDNNNNEILDEQEIINYSGNSHEENELKKKFHNEKRVYIPEFMIEDQMLNRDVLSSKPEIFGNSENYSETEIINYSYEPIVKNSIKKYTYKNKIYIPKYFIEDIIINREVLPNKNKEFENLENISEEEIINYNEFINGENENKKLKKKFNNKFQFYLPEYIFEEQIINREIETNNKQPYENELENENIKENEIITNYLNEKKENNEIKIKKIPKENKIYLPKYVIEDQIIKREVISDNKNI